MFGKKKNLSAYMGSWNVIGTKLDDATAEDCAHTLESVPLFAKLRPADRRSLGTVSVIRSFPAGAVLVEEGQQPGVGLYVILQGRVSITQHSPEGERMLEEIGKGQMFGEMALIDDEPRSATATALTPTLVFITPIFDFKAALERNPEVAAWLLSTMARRIRRAEDHTHDTHPA